MDTKELEALHGLLGTYGQRWRLVPPPGAVLIPAVHFLDGGALEQALGRVAANLGSSNLKAVASLWHKHYAATLLQPLLAAMTIAGVGLNGSAGNVSITLDTKGLPGQLHLHDTLPIARRGAAALQRTVLEHVREHHLAPLIDQLRTVTGVPRRVLWTNVANVVADLYDGLARRPGTQRAAAADREALLDSPADLLTEGANPLCGLVRYEPMAAPGLPETARIRSACCQRYLLPGYKPCTTCPRLSPAERVAALAEARIQQR